MSPSVSVIIPTYNRYPWLCDILNALAEQTWPVEDIDVIVVDDGSTDDTPTVVSQQFPFKLQYVRQKNQGDAAARNTGARHSRADVLVFLDDDIVVAPAYLEHIVPHHEQDRNVIVVGTEHLWLDDSNPLREIPVAHTPAGDDLVEIAFTDVCSNNMSIGREAYIAIGMMDRLDFPGSSMWCDVDMAYRARKAGFRFYRSQGALCWHRDHVARSLDTRKRRMRTASYRAVVLFQKYPELLDHIPMFADKIPIHWRSDSTRLLARKLLRRIISTRLALWGMERGIAVLERVWPHPALLEPLSRWVVGGHIFHGYREGLRAFGAARTADQVTPND